MAIIQSTQGGPGSMFPEMKALLGEREVIIRLRNHDEALALLEADLNPQFTTALDHAIRLTWPRQA